VVLVGAERPRTGGEGAVVEVARHLLPLAAIAAVTLSVASWMFRRRME